MELSRCQIQKKEGQHPHIQSGEHMAYIGQRLPYLPKPTQSVKCCTISDHNPEETSTSKLSSYNDSNKEQSNMSKIQQPTKFSAETMCISARMVSM